jgi:hypothetical protein
MNPSMKILKIKVQLVFLVAAVLFISGCCRQHIKLFFSGPAINSDGTEYFYITAAHYPEMVLTIDEENAEGIKPGSKVVWKAKNGSNLQLWKKFKTFLYSDSPEAKTNNRHKSISFESAGKSEMVLAYEGKGSDLKLIIEKKEAKNSQAWKFKAPCAADDQWALTPYPYLSNVLLINSKKAEANETHPPSFGNFKQTKGREISSMLIKFEAGISGEKQIKTVKHNIVDGVVFKLIPHLSNKKLSLMLKEDIAFENNEVVLSKSQDFKSEYWKAIAANDGYFYFESLIAPNYILTATGTKEKPGNVILSLNKEIPSQRWKPKLIEKVIWVDQKNQGLEQYTILINEENGSVLTVPGNSINPGTFIECKEFVGAGGQRFDFEEIPEEKYLYGPMKEGFSYSISKGLAMAGSLVEENKAVLSMLANNGEPRTKWRFIPVEEEWGLLYCENLGDNWFVTVGEKDTNCENPVIMDACLFYDTDKNSEALEKQLWKIHYVGKNEYRFESKGFRGRFVEFDIEKEGYKRKLFLGQPGMRSTQLWTITERNEVRPISFEDLPCAKNKQKITFDRLKCLDTQAGGADDIFIKVKIDDNEAIRYPSGDASISLNDEKGSDIWEVNKTWEFENILSIEVYEDDSEDVFNFNNVEDLIGHINFGAGGQEGSVSKKINLAGEYLAEFTKTVVPGSNKNLNKITVEDFHAREFDPGVWPWSEWDIIMSVKTDIPGQELPESIGTKELGNGDSWEINRDFYYKDSIRVQFLHNLVDEDTLVLSEIVVDSETPWTSGDYHRASHPVYYHHYPDAPTLGEAMNNAFGPGKSKKSGPREKIIRIDSEFHSYYHLDVKPSEKTCGDFPKLRLISIKCLALSDAISVKNAEAARDNLYELTDDYGEKWDVLFAVGGMAFQIAIWANEHDPGEDDLYLTIDGNKFWPVNASKKEIDKNEKFSIDITKGKWHRGRTFGIWEVDKGDDDFLGEINIDPAIYEGKNSVKLFSTLHHSLYEITFEILE